MIQLKNICKRFGTQTVLDHVSLDIRKGEIHALLGTNGAGKSTLIRIVAGLLLRENGGIYYGQTAMTTEHIRQIGFVFDEPLYLPYLSAGEYLEFVCRLIGMEPKTYRSNIDEILSLFSLPAGRKPINTYSNGMKSKVSFGAAMIHAPEFLVLDEPFNGIDFITTRKLVKILKQRAQEGMGILITSHQFDIIAEPATHFSVLHGSEIILSKPREQLHEEAEKLFADLPVGEAVKNYVENAILA